MPTTTATAAAAAPAEEQGQAQVPVPVEQRDGADDGADGGEGHLAEADLARPAGEHDDRAADDGEHDEGRGRGSARRDPSRAAACRRRRRPPASPTGVADPHLGEVAEPTAGRSRTLPASVSDDSASRSVRCASSWRTTMAAKTTPARTASPSAGFVGSFHATPCCEDAERDGGGGDDGQLGEVAQRQRGQGGHERGEAVGRDRAGARRSRPGRRC